MIRKIVTIYGKEIEVGQDYRAFFSEDDNDGKIVSSINEINHGINYRVNFKDNTFVDVRYNLLSKILE